MSYPLPPPSAPARFNVQVQGGYESNEEANEFGLCVVEWIKELSRVLDLSTLDGVTVADDYAQALANLDHGRSHPLVATENGHGVGVAMTPALLRDGMLKSHIVLNSHYVRALEKTEDQDFPLALHILAHECAHVEVTAAFDRSFPGVLLRHAYPDFWDQFHWEITLACWDEYAVTRLTARIGAADTAGYEKTFLSVLAATPERVAAALDEHLTHGDHYKVAADVYGAFGELLKFAAYHLGNLDGHGIDPQARPLTAAALHGHPIVNHFDRFHELLRALFASYGKWSDMRPFEAIGKLADELVATSGLQLEYVPEGVYVHVRRTAPSGS